MFKNFVSLLISNNKLNLIAIKQNISTFCPNIVCKQFSNDFSNQQNLKFLRRYLRSECKQLAENDKQNHYLVTECLKKSFGLRSQQIQTLLDNYPNIKNRNVNELQDICSLLKSLNVSLTETATKRTWVLMTNKSVLIYGLKVLMKNKLLDQMSNEKTFMFCMFLVHKKHFDFYSKVFKNNKKKLFLDFDERLEYFCRHLDINCQEFCSLVKRNLRLITRDMNTIEDIMTLLKDNCVSNEDIVKDFWIFNHSLSHMRKRIKECESCGHPIRAWILRCSDKVWYPLLDRWKQNIEVLGEQKNTKTFLVKKLSLSDQQIHDLIQRYPKILSIHPKKLDNIIGLLYELGYNSFDITKCPRILFYSFERIQRRLTDNRNKCFDRFDLNVILKSEESFEEYIEKLDSEQSDIG